MINKDKIVRLSEFKSYPFKIPRIDLNVLIYQESVIVESIMKIEPLSKVNGQIILNGVNLELEEISIQGEVLSDNQYFLSLETLSIQSIPLTPFELRIRNRIDPYKNSSLEGLYLSESLITTQCEAEGFRRICFHPDRPDVLSEYTVRIEADYQQYPTLLSNGNKVSSSTCSFNPSRHQVTWHDPFPKPCYLFALVAGRLEKKSDTFTTASNRIVAINIYVEKGDKNYCSHAINSLKKAMSWDEKVYGFQYDLDEYNIVAVRHFNMGAMENKSLNIFNSKLVLADSKIATDDELVRIESVIAHEYFHNWTGNRITCRDWFQLSLKEGLTVFRDQSFTADLHSDSEKRIEDASFLRNTQFLEDSGPTSHAVKPSHYLAIDNFYTTTIYEKGAELIRMLYNMLGHKSFMDGMSEYVMRFDGCAATTEDFINSLIEGAIKGKSTININIDQFSNWYYQSGTPHILIARVWDRKLGKLTLKVHQINPRVIDNNNKDPLLIPLIIGLNSSHQKFFEERILILDKFDQEFIIEGFPIDSNIPNLSLFRRFSAPVTWESDLSLDEIFYLFNFDDDPFSRWNSGQHLMRKALLSRSYNSPELDLEDKLISTFDSLITTLGDKDPEALSTLLKLPGLAELELANEPVDPISLYESRIYLESLFGKKLSSQLKAIVYKLSTSCLLAWPRGKGARKMTALAWRWLALGGDIDVRSRLLQVIEGDSMTMTRAALNALHSVDCQERELAMKSFYNLWKDRPVILDAWFSLEAGAPRVNGLGRVRELMKHPRFDPMAPNALRAVLGGFTRNTKAFHSEDGSGYKFIANQIIYFDKRNPITTSRIAKIFCRWRSYLPNNSLAMHKELCKLAESELSSNTREVIELILSE